MFHSIELRQDKHGKSYVKKIVLFGEVFDNLEGIIKNYEILKDMVNTEKYIL